MSITILDFAVTSIALSISFFLHHITVRVPKGLRLPPGPPRHPIWGNLKDLPSGNVEYKVYEKLAEEYGNLVYLNVLGQSILLINSAEMERELFNKKGAIYSGRIRTTMLHDLTHFGDSTVITVDYGEQWTQYRTILHDLISSKSVVSFHPLLEESARFLARRLIAEPVNDLKVTRYVIGKFIMKVRKLILKTIARLTILELIYGIDISSENDPYLRLAEGLVGAVAEVCVPGAYLVDILPILKYIPSWIPGVKFHKVAEQIERDFQDMLDLLYNHAKAAFTQGKYEYSFVSNYLEGFASTSAESPRYPEEMIRQVAVTAYIAGIDTIEHQIRLFFLAVALHPDAQKKAQDELDTVVGRDSLPSFADLPRLPYLNAFLNEVLRWHPAAPMGLPHQLKQDDVINGYFIPQGTICIGNTWVLFRSEKEYGPDTHKFRPERFLDGSAKVKPDLAFGYGRRVCPGKALAESFLSIVIATMLHTTNISMLKDEPLSGIIEKDEFTPGTIARPRDFRCRIDARSDVQIVLNQLG